MDVLVLTSLADEPNILASVQEDDVEAEAPKDSTSRDEIKSCSQLHGDCDASLFMTATDLGRSDELEFLRRLMRPVA